MTLLSPLDWLSIAGFVLSAAGITVAVIQTYRAWQATKNLENEKRARNAAIWHNIALVLNAYETLEDARSYAKKLSDAGNIDALVAKLSSARRCVVDQYLDLLKAAVLDEPEFTEDTLKRWISQG